MKKESFSNHQTRSNVLRLHFHIMISVRGRTVQSNPSAVQHQNTNRIEHDGGGINNTVVISQENYLHSQERETFYLPTGPAWTNNSHSNSSETYKIGELSAWMSGYNDTRKNVQNSTIY
jgi:hypothetical protein